MSSQPATSTTTGTNTQARAPLPGPQASGFQNLWGNVGNTLNSDLGLSIPQNTVAGPTTAQQSGVNQMLSLAPGLGSNATSLSDLASKISSGYFTNPQNNPDFQGAAKAAIAPITQNLQNSIIPQIWGSGIQNSGAGGGPGAYGSSTGGSPTDLAAEQALQNWTNTAGGITSQMANQAYQGGLNLFQQAPAISQAATTAALTPSAVTEGAGSLEQGWNQGALQNILNAYMMNTQQPLNIEQSAGNILSTGGFGTGTGTNQTQTVGTPPSMLTQILQGLFGGANALSSLSKVGNPLSNIGSVIPGFSPIGL